MRSPVHAWVYLVVTVAMTIPMTLWCIWKSVRDDNLAMAVCAIGFYLYSWYGLRKWRELK